MTTNSFLIALSLTFAAAPVGVAQPPQGGPPQEALDACDGQDDGSLCAFTGRRGETLEGTCRAPQGRALACVPAGHNRR